MSTYRHGLLIGKFYPPHRGHHAAIRAAAAQCKRFTVLVMAAAVETVPLSDRVAWLQEEHAAEPRIQIVGILCDAPLDLTHPGVWTAQIAAMRAALRLSSEPSPVDAVFCGETYGSELALRMGAAAVPIERSGINSTAVRRDLAGCWDDLAASTRSGLTTRVVVVGAESTGTTTVSRLLAEHFAACGGPWASTQWVAEYGREYTQAKWDGSPGISLAELSWSTSDFDVIAVEQTRQEEIAARVGSPVLVCDTDAFATAVWRRRYLGQNCNSAPPWAQKLPPRAVYLVTDHMGVPWRDDGLREGDLSVREAMTEWFVDGLTAAGHSWVLLSGSLQDRLEIAIRTIEPLLEHRARFGEPLHGPGFERSL